MASKLKLAKAVKTYVWQSISGCFYGRPEKEFGDEDAMLVPMAQYKALVKCANPELVRAHTKLISERRKAPAMQNELPKFSGKKACVKCGAKSPATLWRPALAWNSCDRNYNMRDVFGLPTEEYGDWLLRCCEHCGYRWVEATKERSNAK